MSELRGDSSEQDEVVYVVEKYGLVLADQYQFLDITTSLSGRLWSCTVFFVGLAPWTTQVRATDRFAAEREVNRQAEKLPYEQRGWHVEAI